MDWRERYEVEAKKAMDAFASYDEQRLVARIHAGLVDPMFAIWRTIGAKGTVEGAADALWTFLRDHPGKPNMLHRYHCAAALFRILGMDDPASENPLRRRVQWDHEGEEARQQALAELRALIDERIAAAG